ncbi:MAG: GMC family oxidoreductase [Gammaproteobacteria bacterium]|nr:GMC family oxidoreductase [Gammaproteobacteria bacterium]
MIFDLSKLQHARLPEYDLCIVGSGAAGMTLANELLDQGLRICVLESGKLKPTKQADALRKVHSEGIHIKDHSRERVLGGASTTWGGLSNLLDSVDMKPRPFVRYSGWPIFRDELLSYYEQAAERYRFAPPHLFESYLDVAKWKGDIQPSWNELEEKIFLATSNPLNFGKQFKHIFAKPEVDLYLDATLIRLEGDGQKCRIAWGVVRTSKGHSYQLKSRIFVLATGGIENARILLNSRDICPHGLGNEQDQVGRYLMNHPKNCYGVIRLRHALRELPYYFGCVYQGYSGYAGLKLKESVQEERGCLSSYVRFEPLFSWSGNPGVTALVFLGKRNRRFFQMWKACRLEKIVPLRDYSETGDDSEIHIRDYSETGEDSELQSRPKSARDWLRVLGVILLNMPQVVKYLYYRLYGATPEITAIRLRNFMEMAPHPENRVILGDEKDAYDQPIPVVRLQTTELDRHSLIALHRTLAEEIARNGLGELTSNLHNEEIWPIDRDASHHLGATRMGENPRSSVVNPDCRLHTVENVYVAGGSVFPTSACSNPTFTIVALSIRLAQHLKKNVY